MVWVWLTVMLCTLGYSTMCGHACISLGRYAVDYKLVKPVSPETRVNIQCPCGLVPVYVQYNSKTGQSGSVRFENVPSFAFATDRTVLVGEMNEIISQLHYDFLACNHYRWFRRSEI